MAAINPLVRQLRGDEGIESCAYQDHLGYWTIGIGRLIDRRKKGAGLRPVEIDFLLSNDIADRTTELGQRLSWFSRLDPVRQGVLLNMSFQLGVNGLLAFRQALGAVERGNYEAAAQHMLDSLWARQTPERAQRMARQMRTGEWVFSEGC